MGTGGEAYDKKGVAHLLRSEVIGHDTQAIAILKAIGNRVRYQRGIKEIELAIASVAQLEGKLPAT